MMEMAKVTSKGQITIPISIRRKLGISEGDKILFLNKEDGVLMVNPDTFQGDLSDEIVESPAKASTKTPAIAPTDTPAIAPTEAPAKTPTETPAIAPNETPAIAPNETPPPKVVIKKKATAIKKTTAPVQVKAPVPTPATNETTNEAPPPNETLVSIENAVDIEETYDTEEVSFVQTADDLTPAVPVEPKKKAELHAGGVNLSTLLDDIRSIGSNI
jgi:AbrB family looped-hinge helix DNA binding protein